MPIDLGTVHYAVLVADADTPSNLTKYNGLSVPIPDGIELPATLDSITFNGLVFWGYARQNPVSGNTEWIMSAPADPTATMLDALPGPDGWTVPDSREQVRQVGITMRRKGITGAELRPAFQAVWAAIIAERDAEILAAGGDLGSLA
jgi:hypothetical protein